MRSSWHHCNGTQNAHPIFNPQGRIYGLGGTGQLIKYDIPPTICTSFTTLWSGVWRLALIHWGRVTHICVSKRTIIGSDNGLSPGRRQAIIWTSAGILLIGSWGTNFSEIFIGNQIFSFKKMHLKMSSAKWRPFCLGLNVLINYAINGSGNGQSPLWHHAIP